MKNKTLASMEKEKIVKIKELEGSLFVFPVLTIVISCILFSTISILLDFDFIAYICVGVLLGMIIGSLIVKEGDKLK